MSWLLVLLLSAHKASAHSNLLATGNFPPRNASTGLKTAPCGGVARTAVNRVVAPGATVTVQWQETINHPGRFEFYFSPAGDANMVLLKTVPDTQDTAIVGTNYHMYSTTLTMPTTPCANCTLQMIQVMTENPLAPTNYYSCSDIQISSVVPPGTSPAPVTPPPTPPPTTDPNCP
jgi:hypothetical protein